jgi:flagellin
MRINHNISSMVSQGALFSNNRAIGQDLERLSTGLRINRASDDAAGLAISQGLRAQVRGQEQAKKNALDGMSALNIAEGAANELHAILDRMREIAVQSSTATYGNTERDYMNQEFKQLRDEIDRITQVTNFNGLKLLDSTATASQGIFVNTSVGGASSLQVDANNIGLNGSQTNGAENRINVTYTGTDTTTLGLSSTSVTAAGVAQTAIDDIDNAIKKISDMRANIGSYINRLESTVTNLTVSATNQQAAESQIRDVDFAYQSSQFTKNQILTQSATAMLTQANASTQGALSLIR